MKYWTAVAVIVAIFSNGCIAQTLESSTIQTRENVDFTIYASLPRDSFSLSTPQLDETLLALTIKNASRDAIVVLPPIHTVTHFSELALNYLRKGEARVCYHIQLYDLKYQDWIDLENDKIYNDVDYVPVREGDTVERITVNQNKSYVESLLLFRDVHFNKIGRYRVQVFLELKSKEHFLLILSSNVLEFSLTE
jgi:hypothetical protein